MFIYDSTGKPVAFARGEFIYKLSGAPVARVRESHAFRLTGEYVGELYEGMVVARSPRQPSGIGRLALSPPSIPPMTAPPVRGAPRHAFMDMSKKLLGL